MRGRARLAMRSARGRLDALFAAADTNKDGKLTKDELANFVWKRFAKADANGDQAVTKEELQNFAKQRVATLRAERPGHRHRPQGDAAKAKKAGTKPGAAQPKPAPAPTQPQSKPEPKAEIKPPAKPASAAAQDSPQLEPAPPAAPVVSKLRGISQAETGQSSATKNTGPKIGTSTTSGDVKAALFAARR
jgi:hypothetical protein